MFADDWFPVQVKQSEKVGRPEIDKFQAVMEREGADGRQHILDYNEDDCRAMRVLLDGLRSFEVKT